MDLNDSFIGYPPMERFCSYDDGFEGALNDGDIECQGIEEDQVGLPAGQVRFGSINVAGLAGKSHLVERLMDEERIDLLFLSETWTAPGTAARLCSGVVASQEFARAGAGRCHYGQCIVASKERLQDVRILFEDTSAEKSFIAVSLWSVVFVCCYFRPRESVEWIEQCLDKLEELIPWSHPVVIMGDLNARHQDFGDHAANSYGAALLRFMRRLELTRPRPRHGKWTFVKGMERSIVDHVIGNEEAINNQLQFAVCEERFFGATEHQLLLGTVLGTPPTQTTFRAAPRPWNRWRLKEDQVAAAYWEYLDTTLDLCMAEIENCQAIASDQEAVNLMDEAITRWINDGLHKVIGRSSGKGRRPADFLTPELIAKEAVLESFQLECLHVPFGSPEYLNATARVERSRRELNQEISSRRGELFAKFAQDLQEMQPCAQMRMMNAIKTAKGRNKGSLLRVDVESLIEYRRFYARQYENFNEAPAGPVLPLELVMEREEPVPAFEASPFSYEAILNAILEMPEGKATGHLGIPSEALSTVADLVAWPILRLFERSWKAACVPESWKLARIQPVPKKGDLTVIKNYRPISLTETLRRLYERMLVRLLSEAIEPLQVEQGGFRNHRGTLDQAAVLQEWIVQCKALRKERFLAFLDIKAAYDQVDRDLLWRKCLAKGLSPKLVNVLRALFDSNKAYVAINGTSSPEFDLKSGLLQGSPLSPILYSLFINDLIEDVNECNHWDGNLVKIGGRVFRCLLYADDIVLFSNNWDHLKEMLAICEDHSVRNRYRYGVSKCEAVLSKDMLSRGPLKIYGEALTVSKEFTYLGIPFGAGGILWKEHIQRAGNKMLKAAFLFNELGCNGCGFDTATCLRLYHCFVRPIMEYGLALCPANLAKDVQRFFSQALRIMTSCGKSSGVLTVGLFGEIHPADVRLATLQYKFRVRSQSKGRDFALYFARIANERKKLKGSVFTNCMESPMWIERMKALNDAALRRSEPEIPKVYDMQDSLLAPKMSMLSSAFIFRDKCREERKRFRRGWSKLIKADQRAIFNWVLNRSVGPWKPCHQCGLPALKKHMEGCALNLPAVEDLEPSWIEVTLQASCSPLELIGLANMIQRIVGPYRRQREERN